MLYQWLAGRGDFWVFAAFACLGGNVYQKAGQFQRARLAFDSSRTLRASKKVDDLSTFLI
jgi:hypothetical protein